MFINVVLLKKLPSWILGGGEVETQGLLIGSYDQEMYNTR